MLDVVKLAVKIQSIKILVEEEKYDKAIELIAKIKNEKYVGNLLDEVVEDFIKTGSITDMVDLFKSLSNRNEIKEELSKNIIKLGWQYTANYLGNTYDADSEDFYNRTVPHAMVEYTKATYINEDREEALKILSYIADSSELFEVSLYPGVNLEIIEDSLIKRNDLGVMLDYITHRSMNYTMLENLRKQLKSIEGLKKSLSKENYEEDAAALKDTNRLLEIEYLKYYHNAFDDDSRMERQYNMHYTRKKSNIFDEEIEVSSCRLADLERKMKAKKLTKRDVYEMIDVNHPILGMLDLLNLSTDVKIQIIDKLDISEDSKTMLKQAAERDPNYTIVSKKVEYEIGKTFAYKK